MICLEKDLTFPVLAVVVVKDNHRCYGTPLSPLSMTTLSHVYMLCQGVW